MEFQNYPNLLKKFVAMKKSERLLKIKIDNPSFSKEEWDNIARWEDEGGFPTSHGDLESVSLKKMPLKPGQVFEIMDTGVIFEEGKPYYLVRIHLLSLH